jgi:hypothetical protein
MTGQTAPETRPNHDLDRIGEIMEKLAKGERVELHDIGLDERIRAEKFMEKSKENFNVAIRVSSMKIRVKSGGYEIQIKDNKVIVYGKDGGVVHEYVNECLVKNLTTLLMTLMGKYNIRFEDRWITVSLPRQDRDVRKMQSWVLALITNFSKPLKNNPLICG